MRFRSGQVRRFTSSVSATLRWAPAPQYARVMVGYHVRRGWTCPSSGLPRGPGPGRPVTVTVPWWAPSERRLGGVLDAPSSGASARPEGAIRAWEPGHRSVEVAVPNQARFTSEERAERALPSQSGMWQPRPAAPWTRTCARGKARRSDAPGNQAAIGRRRSLSWNLGGGTCAHDATGKRRICARLFALEATSYHCLTGHCFWSPAGHAFVSNAPVPSASPDGSSDRKVWSALQSRWALVATHT